MCRTATADNDPRIEDINKSCLEQFRTHWQCLENNNQQLWQCRPAEWKLNKCVYDNLVRRPPSPIPPSDPTLTYPPAET